MTSSIYVTLESKKKKRKEKSSDFSLLLINMELNLIIFEHFIYLA